MTLARADASNRIQIRNYSDGFRILSLSLSAYLTVRLYLAAVEANRICANLHQACIVRFLLSCGLERTRMLESDRYLVVLEKKSPTLEETKRSRAVFK